jgi:hypothetical protein
MSQLVDPFVPVAHTLPKRPPKHVPTFLQHKPLTHVQPQHQHTAAARTTSSDTLPRRAPQPYRSSFSPKLSWLDRHPRTHRILSILQFPAVLIGSLAAGIVAQSMLVGQIILLIYIVAALVFRIQSRTTFSIAFFLFCGLAVMLIFRTNNTIATNFAVYAFILLAVGVLSLLRELKERYV